MSAVGHAGRSRSSSSPTDGGAGRCDHLTMSPTVAIELVTVAAGVVTLVDRRTQRRWSIELADYRIAAFPVTQAQYAAVTGQRPSATTGDRLPVEGVSWWDAVGFCNALSVHEGLTPTYRIGSSADRIEWDSGADGYRLPTEGEWEHACRAGTTGPRYGPLDEVAWHRGNSGDRVHEVGGKRPNAWGLYDMLGNVWDWCWDIYDAQVYGPYRVLRGGGWFDEHWSCRAGVRRRSHPSLHLDDVGFRLARCVLPRPGPDRPGSAGRDAGTGWARRGHGVPGRLT